MIYKFTYTLGRSLYVPITSRCNSIPLPLTRGDGFVLPKAVAQSLVNVRNMEEPGCVREDIYNEYSEDDRVMLPRYDFPLVNSLYKFHYYYNDLSKHIQQQKEIKESQEGEDDNEYVVDDGLEPSIESLVNEVTTRLNNDRDNNQFDQVVIAGEGEPTLRMDALLAVAHSIKPFREEKEEHNTNKSSDRYSTDKLPVRLITNGLCYGIANLGYSPYNLKRSGVIIPQHRHVTLRDMKDACISRVSVALNTANRHEYDLLMEPSCYTGGGIIGGDGLDSDNTQAPMMPGIAHDLVCEFIMEAAKLGMDVEITGIDREGVDRVETERLARLLLSVSPDKYRRRNVRWRKYFD